MAVVAEGVETAAQMDFVRAIGIEIVQGFYYSEPLPLEAFVEFYYANQRTLKRS